MFTIHSTEPKTGGRWTKDEHQRFLYGLKLYGKNWKKIEDLIETRTSTQIRSHAQKFFIKIKKHQKFDEDSEIQQSSHHTKFGQETQICPQDIKMEKEKFTHSFYLEQITSNFKNCEEQGREFNFWSSLIDSPQGNKHRSCEVLNIPHEFELDLRRANSLTPSGVTQKSSSCETIGTSFSSFLSYSG